MGWCELEIESGVTSIAMESTGVYWVPAYEVLEQHGFGVILVNARYAKNVPDRKNDVAMQAGCVNSTHTGCYAAASGRPQRSQHSGLSAPAGTIVGICCSSYPAHAEGPDGDESSVGGLEIPPRFTPFVRPCVEVCLKPRSVSSL